MITDQFDRLSFRFSRIITLDYSTSFSMGISMLHKRFHQPVYAIYGYVRLADEIVDTFNHPDTETVFKNFSKETFLAIEQKFSTNPVLQAFQIVVNQFSIDMDLIEGFLKSMEMDLKKQAYDCDSYNEYIYGSAEVVGLMCLKVFCEGDERLFQSLRSSARKLGSAFQKVNFLRDMKSDYAERGRVYFPGIDFYRFTEDDKHTIESDIESEFKQAYSGIMGLPEGAKFGVLTAFIYYRALFQKIRMLPAAKIHTERIRVANSGKLLLLAKTWFRYHLNLL
jgi:15-cis-phytoene synthase